MNRLQLILNSFLISTSLLAGVIQSLPTSLQEEATTSTITENAAKAYQVTTLPGLSNVAPSLVPEMYAGHISITNDTTTSSSGSLFFWKFLKPSQDSQKLIIWLNGGPGCSSMDGALMESGPFRVTEDLQLEYNEGSFHEAADIVYVDQPRGTGFSSAGDQDGYDVDLDEVALHFVQFLKNYYQVFPEDLTKDLYITGESYAGQYIPFIAKAVLEDAELADVSLQGLVIGNGWIDPVAQSLSYIPYLLESQIISTTDKFWPSLMKDQEHCQNAINNPGGKDAFSITICENILNRILLYTKDTSLPEDQQCLNMYDTQLRDSYPSCGMNWPPDLKNVISYLTQTEFVKAVNVDPSKAKVWRECDSQVSKFLKNKHSKPSIHLLPDILQRLEIVLFGGDRDIICNNRGVLDLIDNMQWLGSKGYSELMQTYDWKYDGNKVGEVKTERNLTFVNVFNSSHMVPFDKPLEARGVFDIMIKNFDLKTDGDNDQEYLETPIYSRTSQGESNNNNNNENDTSNDQQKSSLPFLFYLIVVISFGLLAYYYNKDRTTIGTKPILRSQSDHSNSARKRSNKKKKTVSWADFENQLEEGKLPADCDEDLELGEVRKSGKFGKFFNQGSSSQGKYTKASSGPADLEEENGDDDEFDLSVGSSYDENRPVGDQQGDIELDKFEGSEQPKKEEGVDDEFDFDLDEEIRKNQICGKK